MNRSLWFGFLAALSLLWMTALAAPAAPAQPEDQERRGETRLKKARVLAAGVFSSRVVNREMVVTVADGIKDTAEDFQLLRRGSKVEAGLGEGVGLRYVLEGEPRGAGVVIDVVVRHPEMTNPDTQQPMNVSTAQFERRIGQVEHTVWSFDTPAGLVPGRYVIELLHQGRSLARQEFTVRFKR